MSNEEIKIGSLHPRIPNLAWNGFEYILREKRAATHSEDESVVYSGEIAKATRALLESVDPKPFRAGIEDTPNRVEKAWKFWTSGYEVDIAKLLETQFEDGGTGYDEMVIVKDIPVYSKCEHHLADIFGTATVAYIPGEGKVVGLSKISRVVNAFARRLQVQERMTKEIADAIDEHLKPAGVGVIIRARHMCMESRGICQQGHHTITSALRGVLKTEAAARAEFMALAR